MKKIISALTISVLIIMSAVPAFAVTAETKSSDFTYSKMPNGNLKITGYKGFDTVISVPATYNNRKVTVIKSFDIFSKAKVTTIKIYKNIKRIGNTNVSNLPELKTIKVSANNLWYSSVDGVLYNKAKTDLLACPVKRTAVTIPKTVTDISSNAFKNCSNIKSISIPTAIKNIGSYAFYNTGLTKVTLPKNIKSIGNYAFGAYELESKPAYNSDFVISSSKNSVGQAYAESNGLKFNELLLIQAIAHRGDYIDAIPDTLQALDQAKAKGYKYSEFDIWETNS
ncbi:MAG: leucine-rich repeat protein, partial [Ruminococcus sp.]